MEGPWPCVPASRRVCPVEDEKTGTQPVWSYFDCRKDRKKCLLPLEHYVMISLRPRGCRFGSTPWTATSPPRSICSPADSPISGSNRPGGFLRLSATR